MASSFEESLLLSEIGEKKLIGRFIRPFFEAGHSDRVIGDDCALIEVPSGSDVVASTDRVPADLVAFRLGVINHAQLGRYLAVLNLSDIAAAGGTPVGLLLNMGLPASMSFGELKAICEGFRNEVEANGARVIGGDITSSRDLSLSATSFGIIPKGGGLKRNGARPGDQVFVCRPIGITPAAFHYFLSLKEPMELQQYREDLIEPFTRARAQVSLGSALRESGFCSSCIDNTDGYSESLYELACESGVRIILEKERIAVAEPVRAVAEVSGLDPLELAFMGGADFGLVGTVRSHCKSSNSISTSLHLIGRAEEGDGVFIDDGSRIRPLPNTGWDYFKRELSELPWPVVKQAGH